MRGHLHKPEIDFWPRLVQRPGPLPTFCWIWSGATKSNGYGNISVGGGCIRMTHRYAWFLTHGIWPTNHVLHDCDTPSCCNPAHLHVGNDLDNMREAKFRNRTAHGVGLPQHKLTESQVMQISFRYTNENISMRKLGKDYQVGPQTVCDIVNRKRWGWLLAGTPAKPGDVI